MNLNHGPWQRWTNAIFVMLNVAAGNGYGNAFIETNAGISKHL